MDCYGWTNATQEFCTGQDNAQVLIFTMSVLLAIIILYTIYTDNDARRT